MRALGWFKACQLGLHRDSAKERQTRKTGKNEELEVTVECRAGRGQQTELPLLRKSSAQTLQLLEVQTGDLQPPPGSGVEFSGFFFSYSELGSHHHLGFRTAFPPRKSLPHPSAIVSRFFTPLTRLLQM